jgi:hypothetical protein
MQSETSNIIQRIVNYGTFIIGDESKFEGAIELGAVTNLDKKVRGEKQSKKFAGSYFFIAQFMPGLFAISPLSILFFELVKNASWLKDLSFLVLLLLFALSVIVPAILVSYPVAFLSQVFECRMFGFRLRYPSTYLLLEEEQSLSTITKSGFRRKYNEVFGESFPSQKNSEQATMKTLISISKSMFRVRQQIKKSYMLHFLTIRYDFTRNSLAAAKVMLVFAPLFLIYGLLKSDQLLIVCESFALLFALITFLKQRKLLRIAAENYARQLIDEFIHQ